MNELASIFNVGLLQNTLRTATPVVLAALGCLFTDHTGFYERYGWEFFCMAQGDGEDRPSRMYIHR